MLMRHHKHAASKKSGALKAANRNAPNYCIDKQIETLVYLAPYRSCLSVIIAHDERTCFV